VIKLVNHNGFIEPSSGVANEGFAVRKNASVVVKFDSAYPKKINIQLHRTSYDWPNAYIKIRINNNEIHKFKVENIGIKNFSIDLLDPLKLNNLVISFSIYPQGIIKNISKAFLAKRKSLVRDSLLISRLYLDENKVINYSNNNRFVHGNLLQRNQNPVRILGFFGQTFGLAEAARRTFQSLEKSSVSVSATQIPYSGKHRGSDHTIKAEKKIPSNTDEIRIFHFNGDHFEKLISYWGESILDCKYKIGFWHWELPEFPDDYLSWLDMVDEIWVPSRFVFDAIAPKSPKPVQIIPLPLDDTVLKLPTPNREKFNIPQDKIVFLITFDFYSVMERKNPIAGINAFLKLIENDKYKNRSHIVIKTSNQHADYSGNKCLEDLISCIDPTQITLINQVLSRHDMLCLIKSCDSLVSLHRSEGFGLHIAEAMAMGKAVIATNWGGNTDFMNSNNSYPVDYNLIKLKENHGPYRKGKVWAEPSISSATELMSSVVDSNLKQNFQINYEAKRTVLNTLSAQKVRELIVNRLKYCSPQ
jgi:glycosyltransferase involved in cell wall biosynthesis